MYYKLTAIKDLPGVESGFSWTFVADTQDDYDFLPLMPRDVSQKVRDKVNILRGNRKHTEFVRTEPDYARANRDLLCPVCKEHRPAYTGYRADHEPGTVNGGCRRACIRVPR